VYTAGSLSHPQLGRNWIQEERGFIDLSPSGKQLALHLFYRLHTFLLDFERLRTLLISRVAAVPYKIEVP
jgi:hypothetical protein